jgi:biofilm PGA synthesis protein PgaA
MYEKNEKGRHLPSALYKSAARPARHRQAPAPAARLRHGFAAVCAALAPLLCPAPAQAGDDYDALILRARAGDHQPALAMLRALGRAGGPRAIQDRILVASWAGRPDEVTQTYAQLPAGAQPPADVRLAVARALRDLRRWPEALAQFRAGMRAYPSQPAFAAGIAMTLADADRLDEALAAGEQLVRARPRDADAHLALAYVHARRNTPFEALYATDRARDLMPGAAYVEREYVFALQRARMAGAALTHATRRPELYTEAQMRRLQADALAEQVRLASMPTRNEADRFAIADRVLARYDTLIPAWSTQGDETRDDVIRARIDRLHALHARYRRRDLASEYEALRAEGVAVPRYALGDVASAYLYLRQPEQAAAIYQQVAQAEESHDDDPVDRLGNQTGRYYSLAEAEDFDGASQVMDETREGYPAWVYVKGQPMRIPNDLHLQSMQVDAGARLQADDTPEAQARLEGMARNAPNNSTLKSELAALYRARSLPRASERTLKMAETLTPRNIGVENGQGFTALALQEWRQAEALSRDTLARAPENLLSRRLAREWAVHNKAELRIGGYRGLASDSPVSGSGDFGIDAVIYTPPLDYNWRGFAGGGYANGDFEEGRGTYRWARAGAQWRGRDLTVEGEVSANQYGHGARTGLRLSAAYDLDDHWQIGGSAERLSRDTPLRALASGVSSNGLSAYARWRAHERSEWTLRLSPSRFSDGNQRWALGLDGRERIHTTPHLKTDLTLELSSQRNSLDAERPYFNPRSDLMVLPGLRLTHTLHRRYENAWEQIGTLGAGAYTQQGYGTGGVIALGYGQRYRANDVLDMGAMVTGISRPYDGRRERELRITFDLAYRF